MRPHLALPPIAAPAAPARAALLLVVAVLAHGGLPAHVDEGQPEVAAPTPPVTWRPPPVARVVAVALARAGLDQAAGAALGRRARWAGLAPWLTVRTLHRRSWTEEEPGLDRGDTLELRATWRLDRLVFDDAEVRARSIDDGRAKARRELARLVIRLYHRWLRLATSGADALTRAELEAELDDLTAGWFGRVTTPRPPR